MRIVACDRERDRSPSVHGVRPPVRTNRCQLRSDRLGFQEARPPFASTAVERFGSAGHAATSAVRTDSPARAISQSVACCALVAAVKIARESAFSTFSHD